jgi:hypothetical protein
MISLTELQSLSRIFAFPFTFPRIKVHRKEDEKKEDKIAAASPGGALGSVVGGIGNLGKAGFGAVAGGVGAIGGLALAGAKAGGGLVGGLVGVGGGGDSPADVNKNGATGGDSAPKKAPKKTVKARFEDTLSALSDSIIESRQPLYCWLNLRDNLGMSVGRMLVELDIFEHDRHKLPDVWDALELPTRRGALPLAERDKPTE